MATSGVPVLLDLDCSAKGEASVSRRMGRTFEAALCARIPEVQIRRRNLTSTPLPAIDPDDALTPVARELVAELAQSDLLLITAPVHNYTVPAALKLWIDHVVRPGVGFRHTQQGKKGLLNDRLALVLASAGGAIFDDHALQPDFFRPYLAAVLKTIGITSLRFVTFDRSARHVDPLAEAEHLMRDWIASNLSEVLA